MNTRQPFIILSAAIEAADFHQNRTRHDELVTQLRDHGIPFKEISGRYIGFDESGVLVPINDEWTSRTVRKLAFDTFGQESIISVDANYFTTLDAWDGSSHNLGEFKEVSEHSAKQLDKYSRIDGRYYAVV